MRQQTHTRLTIGGFCLAYVGLMGGLLLVGVPVVEGHRLQIVLYWVLPLTVAGIVVIAYERLKSIDPD